MDLNGFGFVILYRVIKVLELLTNGNEAEVAKSWRMPKDMTNGDENNNEWDDYSMLLGYDVPLDSSI